MNFMSAYPLINRFIYGPQIGPSSFLENSPAVRLYNELYYDGPSRQQQLVDLGHQQIETQKNIAKTVAESNLTASKMVAAEISHQTEILHGAIECASKEISGSVMQAADQLENSIYYLGDVLCASLDEIIWQIVQQSEKLDEILQVLKNSRNIEAQQLVKQGVRHYVTGEYQEAEERFRLALTFDTTDYQVLMNLAYIEIHKNNAQESMVFFNKALKLPENLSQDAKCRTLLAIGRLNYAEGNYQDALSNAKQASSIFKEDPVIIYTNAVYACLCGDKSLALKHLEKAIYVDHAFFSKAAVDHNFHSIHQDVIELLSNCSNSELTKLSKEHTDNKQLFTDTIKNNGLFNEKLSSKIEIELSKIDTIVSNPTFSDCVKHNAKLHLLHKAIQALSQCPNIYKKIKEISRELEELLSVIREKNDKEMRFVKSIDENHDKSILVWILSIPIAPIICVLLFGGIGVLFALPIIITTTSIVIYCNKKRSSCRDYDKYNVKELYETKNALMCKRDKLNEQISNFEKDIINCFNVY